VGSAGAMASNEDTSPEPALHQQRNVAHDARVIIATVILAGLVVFALDNRSTTHISWIIGSGDEPLAVLLAGAAIAGALIGWLFLHRPHRSHN
jgi:uncharacterized integral membrane protein